MANAAKAALLLGPGYPPPLNFPGSNASVCSRPNSTVINGSKVAFHAAMTSNLVEPFSAYPPPDSQEYNATDKPSSERSGDESGQERGPKPHRRGYQACENCRSRKSRCVLGNVDHPHEPPCDRCERERRECVFADTRKKKKASDGQESSERPAKRRLTSNSTERETTPSFKQPNSSYSPSDISVPQWNPPVPQHQPQYTSQPREMVPSSYPPPSQNTAHFRSELANDTLHAAAATTQDNLSVLYRAAVETSALQEGAGHVKSPSTGFGSPVTAGSVRPRAFSNNAMTPGHPGLIESASQTASLTGQAAQDDGLLSGIRAWERMRFVRAGWFKAQEAMAYVEYYYAKMAPMTPIVTSDYRPPSKHLALLTEEPILAIAILAIASRHMKLEGYAASSRAYQIHDKLWTYLRNMVERLLWGQEQFGGGFCGGGASSRVVESSSGQMTWQGSLRTIGTIEALLLLTDWQPRALHFPPGDDENRLLDADYNLLSDSNATSDKAEQSNGGQNGSDSLPYAGWLEPSWRSDRMSWMLLGLAQALSFELGVFDNEHYSCKNQHGADSDCARNRRVRRLVLVYVSQNSGRLGIPSMLPLNHWQSDPVFEKTYHAQRKGQPEDPIDIMQSYWLGIATIMYDANLQIFPSRKFTKDLTGHNKYKEVIDKFKPRLLQWKQNFNNHSAQIEPVMRDVLTMEYEYARCYINSLGLQKVVESWVERSATEGADSSFLLRMYNPNREYITEVADAARTILRTVVNGLGPAGHLRNAPVRTYLRTLSGMMFTLKRFSLGDFENEVRQSLDLLEQTTDFLAAEVVDDVHLSNQTSNLVKLIVTNIQKTFIRVQAPANGSETASREGSRQHTPHHGEQEHQQYAEVPRGRTSSGAQRPLHSMRADPLAGIPAQPFAEISSTFMPPPNFVTQGNGYDQNVPIDPNMGLDDWSADWFTLPLNNFFDSTQGSVDQGFGGIGPTVGDRDMLEILTNQQYKQWNGQPGQGGNMFNGFR